ncbi:MAG: cyclase family protein [Pyrinomonadaceae bacterium]
MNTSVVTIDGLAAAFDARSPIDISIPLRFNGPQPNAFGVPAAQSEPCRAGDIVGDTRLGGSCNFESYTFIPHCTGTHTECVGHITNERISVRECLKDVLVPTLLVSIAPVAGIETSETYSQPFEPGDLVVTASSIEAALDDAVNAGVVKAVIIRTLPNDDSKLSRRYPSDTLPPFLTSDAAGVLVESGIDHLLVDLPSIDRMYDDGRLSNHRTFWNVEAGKFEVNGDSRVSSTITELIYVPPAVSDGLYLLNLQIAPFAADAAPSRPILLPLAATTP